ncbi:XVIPCD domain-containing protein [Luteimonas aquatica]|uniref:XVIPCD domain-containing protein n=1 Tax=Luteimonas aquatica TaxID=450364 RepID=UPI001F59533F|nr:XVIPCD domain-containing protein [Luteimonas aquatica]
MTEPTEDMLVGSPAPRTPEEKTRLLTQQREFVGMFREQARVQGDPGLAERADGLQRQYHAREIGGLATDVYDAAEHRGAPPVGWLRASEHPELLRQRYGMTLDDNAIRSMLQPGDSAFRAEIYIPDPAVMGTDARPVLAFKGSNGPVVANENGQTVVRRSETQDWVTNGRQGLGLETDYYNRAMGVASTLQFGGMGRNFEITGHSLGGGMASAAAAVTGAPTITFNASGLHPATAQRYAQQHGVGLHDTGGAVTAYQVSGEVLTDAQTGMQRMDAARRQQLNDVASQAASMAQLPGARELLDSQLRQQLPYSETARQEAADLVTQLASPAGQQGLRNMPVAAGHAQPLLTPMMWQDNRLVDRPQEMALSEVAQFGRPLLDVASAAMSGARAGRTLGEGVAATGDLAGRGLDLVGDGHRAGLQVTGMVGQAGAQTVGQIAGMQVRAGGEVAAQVRLVGGDLAAGVDMAQCVSARWSNATTNALLRGAGRWVPALRDLADARDQETALYCQEQMRQAGTELASARTSAQDIRSTAGQGAAAIERVTVEAGADFRRGADRAGEAANAAFDAAGERVQRTTAMAPTVGAAGGALLGTAVGVAATHNPSTPEGVRNIVESGIFFGNGPGGAGEAVQRHLMRETVLPSMDFRTREMEAEALQRMRGQQRGDHAALLDDPGNPRHSTFRSASDGVHRLDASFNRPSDQRSEQLAGALTVEMARSGLDQASHVLPSRDGRLTFAVQGALDDPGHRRVSVETAVAMTTPLADSSRRVAEIDAARGNEQSQTQVLAMAEPERGRAAPSMG